MKANQNSNKDFLEDIFKDLPLDRPSSVFTENLMMRIEREVSKEKKKNKWFSCLQIATGVLSILFLPGLVYYICTFFIPGFIITPLPQINIPVNPMIIMIGFIVLLLLMADTLFRKYIGKKTFNK